MSVSYIIMALAIAWMIVYLLRPNTVTVHFYYFPIILAAWYWKILGGIAVGLISGILAGPLMLVDVAENVNQLTFSWVLRLVFFVAVGSFIGLLFKQIQKNSQEILDQQREIIIQSHMANMDGLTLIPNRRNFDQVLSEEYMKVSHETSLSLIMIDIDQFKQYNDTYGHIKGDECLIKVAQVIQSSLNRPTDYFARYGGEEFVVILPATDEQGALKVAENIRQNVERLMIPHETSHIKPYVTISLGVETMHPQSGYEAKQLLDRADQALYQAKSQGRNQVMVYKEKA
ncbi:diguanylate cyclase [Filobacillus milosensis]|uniref:Diguanylate cyclase n=1 Tax=Filobacillus milosensis TaxID=94137 RepID=A0A4Y8II23_9BACI|nr:diguanylate cyclase [Filobacillus milosensis]